MGEELTPLDSDSLINELRSLVHQSRRRAARSVNSEYKAGHQLDIPTCTFPLGSSRMLSLLLVGSRPQAVVSRTLRESCGNLSVSRRSRWADR